MARQAPTSIRLHAGAPEPLRAAALENLASAELAATIAAVPLTMMVLDRDHRVIAYSGPDGADAYLNRDVLELLPAEHRDFIGLQLRRVLDGGELIGFDFDFQLGQNAHSSWQRVRLA